MKFNPKVSIVIPVYNGSNFLAEAIESALGQTYDNLEILVINDGSNDEGKTESIAMSYGDSICYYRKENGGVSTALNMAIEKMSGDYLSWLSHDDLYSSDKVLKQVEALQALDEPSKHVVFSDYSLFNVDTRVTRRVKLESSNPVGFRGRLLVNSDVHGCTMLIPREAFRVCGHFNPELKATQDYDMWFRLGQEYTFIHVPENLVTGRVHAEQLGTRVPWRVSENIRLRKQWIDEIDPEEVMAFTGKSECLSFAEIGKELARKCYFNLAAKCAERSFVASARLKLQETPRIVAFLVSGYSYGIAVSVYRALKRLV
ncbi:glycosyltransferase [Marinobacter sp. SS13-12]|uniref:glycosyltransferase n=1 Tax=Marinobacter sp. SS13-12 TaxID=3050451 RepID=UPI002552D947|nr:glycosyltransferase [Marinobacter sp. SS13-12]MDK8463848.1 glycosyltransferase [Marinobacter sp. SS13-12]